MPHKWKENEIKRYVLASQWRERKAKVRPIYPLERIIKVSGVVSPEFLERMRLLGVRVRDVGS